jgi:proline racemase
LRSKLLIQGIDAHTEGCPIRIVTAGAGALKGATMVEKRAALMARDEFRRLVIFEPRGSFNMPAAMLVEPTSPEADIGMIIMEPDTYPPMCGHCALGVATVAVETGIVPSHEGCNIVRLDTPAGVVPARVEVANGRAVLATLEMPTSFLYRDEVVLRTDRFGEVIGAIAFGGDFYFITDAARFGLALAPEEAWDIVGVANAIRAALPQVQVEHPEKPHINQLYQIMLTAPPRTGAGTARNVVICPPQVIDRSPCGTGTAARMAYLYGLGKLRVSERIVHEGILDTAMIGSVTAEAPMTGGYKAISCTVAGRAYITGSFQYYLDPEDPFYAGYRLTGV